MSDFLQMNLNRMSGIRDKTGQIADRRTAINEARKNKLFDAFKSGGQAMVTGLENTKSRQMEDYMADKKYDFEAAEAKKLADERLASENRKYGEGFEQEKDIIKLEAKNRQALADLQASARGEKASDFNPEEVIGNIMTLSIPGQNWEGGPAWRPPEGTWTDEAEAAFWTSADSLLSMYTPEQQAALKPRLDALISQYTKVIPEEPDPISDEGDGKSFFQGGANPEDYSNYGYGMDVKPTTPIDVVKTVTDFTSNRNKGFIDAADSKMNPDIVPPMSSKNNQIDWATMQSMVKQLSSDPAILEDPDMKYYLKEASDGEMRSGDLQSFILFLKKMGATEDTTPVKFN